MITIEFRSIRIDDIIIVFELRAFFSMILRCTDRNFTQPTKMFCFDIVAIKSALLYLLSIRCFKLFNINIIELTWRN